MCLLTTNVVYTMVSLFMYVICVTLIRIKDHGYYFVFKLWAFKQHRLPDKHVRSVYLLTPVKILTFVRRIVIGYDVKFYGKKEYIDS